MIRISQGHGTTFVAECEPEDAADEIRRHFSSRWKGIARVHMSPDGSGAVASSGAIAVKYQIRNIGSPTGGAARIGTQGGEG